MSVWGCVCVHSGACALAASVRETENLLSLEELQRAVFAFVCGEDPVNG